MKQLRKSVMIMTLIFGEQMMRNCLFPYISREKARQVFQREVLEWADEFDSSYDPEKNWDIEIREFTIRKLRDKGFLKNDLPKSIPADALTKDELSELVHSKAQYEGEDEKAVAEKAMDRLGHACTDCCFCVDVASSFVCSNIKSPNFMEPVEPRNTCEEWRIREGLLFW